MRLCEELVGGQRELFFSVQAVKRRRRLCRSSIIERMPDAISLREKVNRIVNAHRRGLRDKLQTVELLQTLFEGLSVQDQSELCEQLGYILRTEPLGTKSVRGMGVNIVGLALLALARFGPTDHLTEFVFSRIRLDDSKEAETWAREVYQDFRYCLFSHPNRFSDHSLAQVKKCCVAFRPYDKPLPLPLIEALTDLEFVVEQVEFNRFERSLRQRTGEACPEMHDLGAALVGLSLDPKIAAAIKEAGSYLRSGGEFDPKKAADLLRASIDETDRAVVSVLAKIKGKPYSGKDKDGDRRAYMRDLGFISPAEEKFFSSIYSLISEEASHKLLAPRETVLVLLTTVKNYLLLLLRRLHDWATAERNTRS